MHPFLKALTLVSVLTALIPSQSFSQSTSQSIPPVGVTFDPDPLIKAAIQRELIDGNIDYDHSGLDIRDNAVVSWRQGDVLAEKTNTIKFFIPFYTKSYPDGDHPVGGIAEMILDGPGKAHCPRENEAYISQLSSNRFQVFAGRNYCAKTRRGDIVGIIHIDEITSKGIKVSEFTANKKPYLQRATPVHLKTEPQDFPADNLQGNQLR